MQSSCFPGKQGEKVRENQRLVNLCGQLKSPKRNVLQHFLNKDLISILYLFYFI